MVECEAACITCQLLDHGRAACKSEHWHIPGSSPGDMLVVKGTGACRSAAATGNACPTGEVCTRTLVGTTTPNWQQAFLMAVQDASHSLRVVAVHDAQKGMCCLAWCRCPAFDVEVQIPIM